MKICFKSLLILIFALLLFDIPCEASSEKIGLSINKTIFAFDSSQGSSDQFNIKVKNESTETKKIKIEVADYEVDDQNEVHILEDRSDNTGMRLWIDVEEGSFSLDAAEEKVCNFTLNIPINAPMGSHHSLILVSTAGNDSDKLQSTGSSLSGRIGAHVLVNVKGEVSGLGEISYFDTPRIFENTINVAVEYKNLGNIHYVPYGEVSYRNMITQSEKDIGLEKHFIFPGKSYKYEIKDAESSILAFYKVKANFIDAEGNVLEVSKFIVSKNFLIFLFAFLVCMLSIAETLIYFRGKNKKRSGDRHDVRRIKGSLPSSSKIENHLGEGSK